MKYIAIFDLPEGYKMGCAVGKMISAEARKKKVYEDSDFENTYAQIEPLSEQQAEMFERFNTVDRIMMDLGVGCAYDMPSFWCNNGKDYKVISTKYHKGYMQALEDVEKEVRKRFGFAEKDDEPRHARSRLSAPESQRKAKNEEIPEKKPRKAEKGKIKTPEPIVTVC